MKGPFFTQTPAYSLPHDRIGVRKVLVAHQAIVRAFEMLRSEGYPFASALENDITERLEDKLVNRIWNRGEIDSFDSLFFGKITRANELLNFDGSKKSKKPDLVFHLKRENRVDWDQRQDALFVECKPVAKTHTLNNHYCAVAKDCTGIERFVIGDYAWAMEEALMVGYVRDGFTITHHLAKSLKDPTRNAFLGSPSTPAKIRASSATINTEALHKTKHHRSFHWNTGKSATPIDIYHSWHTC